MEKESSCQKLVHKLNIAYREIESDEGKVERCKARWLHRMLLPPKSQTFHGISLCYSRAFL